MSTPQDPYAPPPGWGTPPTGGDRPAQPPPAYGPPPGYGTPPGFGTPPPGYGTPPPNWGQQQPGWGPPGGVRPTNTLAIVSLVLIFVFAPAALVTGIIARKQIRETGEGGDGMALAGIICGALSIVFGALLVLVFVVAIAAGSSVDTDSEFLVRSLGLARWGA